MTNPEIRLRCLELAQKMHSGNDHDGDRTIKLAQKYFDFLKPKEIK